MNGATLLIGLILIALYGLAIRHICRNGACADCGLNSACPVHQLRRKPLTRRSDLETIRRSTPKPDLQITIRR